MEASSVVSIILLTILLAEVSYLVHKSSKEMAPKRQHKILLDTSVLIDGRIGSIAKTGFITGTLIIPRSVVGELQFLADAADHDKRARARYGLDMVAELQAMPSVHVEILQDGSKADEGVDERLLTLAKKHGASICTLDYNLNKVALVEDITILNVNELAQSLRVAHLPGEKIQIELVQKGQDQHQAVGYLPDGTMVVVEHANKQMGQTVEVEIVRSLQTAAGRMMFARQTTSPTQASPKKRFGNKVLRRSNDKKPASRSKQQQGKRPNSVDAESNLINMVKNS